jgi:hypothetical protein
MTPVTNVHNPWLDIPLADYEGHMVLPHVAQASLLADLFGALLRELQPESVAVLGCAGGNGLDRIDPAATSRVVGVDINPHYVEAMRDRHQGRFARLEAICADVERRRCLYEPVALAWAALLFEYVDPFATINRIAPLVGPEGVLATVVQEPSDTVSFVTPSPYASLAALSSAHRHVAPARLAALAAGQGLYEMRRQRVSSAGGKGFVLQVFRRDEEVVADDD